MSTHEHQCHARKLRLLLLLSIIVVLLAFDQCGFGARMGEIGPFYDRTPDWSQFGRMIDDTRAAIDALEEDANVDPQRISLCGYTLGGAVALHTAALDPRVKSVVSRMAKNLSNP
jgi:dienelactone hydrolase